MINKVLKFIKKNVLLLVLVAVIMVYGGIQTSEAALNINFFKKNGDNIIFTNALYELGSSANRVAKIWTASLDTTAITIGGAAAASIDMGGFDITNGGTFTLENIAATSTTATSSFLGRVSVGTTTPLQIFHVSEGASATTTARFGDASASSKTCFEFFDDGGAIKSFYIVGTSFVIEPNTCN